VIPTNIDSIDLPDSAVCEGNGRCAAITDPKGKIGCWRRLNGLLYYKKYGEMLELVGKMFNKSTWCKYDKPKKEGDKCGL
jgi:hypothetical protein